MKIYMYKNKTDFNKCWEKTEDKIFVSTVFNDQEGLYFINFIGEIKLTSYRGKKEYKTCLYYNIRLIKSLTKSVIANSTRVNETFVMDETLGKKQSKSIIF